MGPMQRISVVGCSGSGKSTLARTMADALGTPVLELDSVMHQKGWVPLSDELFQQRVADFIARDRWIVDGNYISHGIGDLVWPQADTVVWVDMPRSVVMRRVVARTLRRVIGRQVLWNGNREPWRNLYDPRPEHNIILWAWTRYRRTHDRYAKASRDGTWAHLDIHRLRSPTEAAHFVSALERTREL